VAAACAAVTGSARQCAAYVHIVLRTAIVPSFQALPPGPIAGSALAGYVPPRAGNPWDLSPFCRKNPKREPGTVMIRKQAVAAGDGPVRAGRRRSRNVIAGGRHRRHRPLQSCQRHPRPPSREHRARRSLPMSSCSSAARMILRQARIAVRPDRGPWRSFRGHVTGSRSGPFRGIVQGAGGRQMLSAAYAARSPSAARARSTGRPPG
jgi:hypothetical protein